MAAHASPFVLFGVPHLGALACIAAVAAGLVQYVRRCPSAALRVRMALAAVLAGSALAALAWQRQAGTPWESLAPLHLCDAAILLAVWALVTLRQGASELTYFWSCSGTLLALLTPDLGRDFPHPDFLAYFSLHGGVVISGVLLVAGLGRRPAPGAAWRAFLWTNLYAACVAVVNLASGTNFLYLRAKPISPTPLDWFGPWPVYLVVAEAVAMTLFLVLESPFRWADRQRLRRHSARSRQD